MPITKSAKKALRQAKRRNEQNTIKRDAYKAALKKARALALSGSNDVGEAIAIAYKTLDKAAKTNVLSKMAAARKKSRLMKYVHSVTKK